MINKAEQRHNDAITQIWQKPKIIGLENIVLTAKESNMFHDDGNLYHQPDGLCFDAENRVIYNVEYKLNKKRGKAITQLQEQAQWLRRIFPSYEVVNLYVHNNFNVEEIGKKSY
jgi:hypothetical protein